MMSVRGIIETGPIALLVGLSALQLLITYRNYVHTVEVIKNAGGKA